MRIKRRKAIQDIRIRGKKRCTLRRTTKCRQCMVAHITLNCEIHWLCYFCFEFQFLLNSFYLKVQKLCIYEINKWEISKFLTDKENLQFFFFQTWYREANIIFFFLFRLHVYQFLHMLKYKWKQYQRVSSNDPSFCEQ